jgi:rare lipoprotein A (peptidoglycan hydrolase)
MHRIDVLDWRRSQLQAGERRARTRLHGLRTSIRELDGAIASQQQGLDSAQAALAAVIVGDYKSGTSDTAAFVLSSGSFADLVERVDEVSRLDRSSSELLREVRMAQKRLAVQRQTLSARYASVTSEVARLDTARTGLDRAITARRQVLAGLNASIAGQLSAERRRRARLAGQAGASPAPPALGVGSGGFSGEASWYGPGFAGHHTADGEIFDPNKLTAASPWLPFNTVLRVTNLANGLSVEVRINDRGPFGRGVLDLSAHAAQVIGLGGWTEVHATILSSP